MQGIKGLIIAAGFGLAAAMLNWMYLEQKKTEIDMVSFIGVREPMQLGEVFQADNLVEVRLPRNAVTELKTFAVPFEAKQGFSAIIGQPANRRLGKGELLVRQDLDKPRELKLEFEPNEHAVQVPVDGRTFIPSLLVPGEMVSFVIPKIGPTVATEPADSEDGGPTPKPRAATRTDSGSVEIVGPFKVRSVGNRLGTPEVMKAANMPQMQENILTISVRMEGNDLEPKAKKLLAMIYQGGAVRQVGVMMQPRDNRGL